MEKLGRSGVGVSRIGLGTAPLGGLYTAVGDRQAAATPAAALQFPLRHPAVTGIVVGARSPEEVAEDLALAATPIPEALWTELD
ncbi:hypothetical protein [Nonomuraea jabiensis]|uniref:hypothetical protein n=1 Tax=Nonomuraea jabiensis TaxID=882448 RepID=UPI0036C97DF4